MRVLLAKTTAAFLSSMLSGHVIVKIVDNDVASMRSMKGKVCEKQVNKEWERRAERHDDLVTAKMTENVHMFGVFFERM